MSDVHVKSRVDRLRAQVGEDSIAVENGFELPLKPARYLAVEKSDGEAVWVINEDSLEDLALGIDASDTLRASVEVFDLETGTAYAPISRTIGFIALAPAIPERIDV